MNPFDRFRRKLNNRMLRYSYAFKLPVAGVIPSALDIEVTNRCMMNCVSCPRESMDRPVCNMSMDLFKLNIVVIFQKK